MFPSRSGTWPRGKIRYAMNESVYRIHIYLAFFVRLLYFSICLFFFLWLLLKCLLEYLPAVHISTNHLFTASFIYLVSSFSFYFLYYLYQWGFSLLSFSQKSLVFVISLFFSWYLFSSLPLSTYWLILSFFLSFFLFYYFFSFLSSFQNQYSLSRNSYALRCFILLILIPFFPPPTHYLFLSFLPFYFLLHSIFCDVIAFALFSNFLFLLNIF